jgi:hypothetical protein
MTTDQKQATRSPRWRIGLRVLVSLAVLACFLGGVAAFLALVPATGRSTTVTPAPPDHYTELDRIGALVGGVPRDQRAASVSELRTFVESNEQLFPLIQEALAQQPSAPSYLTARARKLPGPILDVARLMLAAGRLAEDEERLDDAVTSYLNLIRIGHRISHGGLLIHLSAGTAYQRAGITALGRMLPKLTAEHKQSVLASLQSIDAEREPVQTVAERERKDSRDRHGWLAYLRIKQQINQIIDRMTQPIEAYHQDQRQFMSSLSE